MAKLVKHSVYIIPVVFGQIVLSVRSLVHTVYEYMREGTHQLAAILKLVILYQLLQLVVGLRIY